MTSFDQTVSKIKESMIAAKLSWNMTMHLKLDCGGYMYHRQINGLSKIIYSVAGKADNKSVIEIWVGESPHFSDHSELLSWIAENDAALCNEILKLESKGKS